MTSEAEPQGALLRRWMWVLLGAVIWFFAVYGVTRLRLELIHTGLVIVTLALTAAAGIGYRLGAEKGDWRSRHATTGEDEQNDLDVAGTPPVLGRKAILTGMLTSGFVIANAASHAGTVRSNTPRATQPAHTPRWTPATAYALGQQVVTPNNDVASASVRHTSSGTFSTDSLKWTKDGAETNTAKWSVSDAGLFVSATGGRDASDGLSPGSAKRTIAAAMSALPRGKGVITLGSGTYSEQNLPLSNGLTIRGSNSTIISSAGNTFTVAADTERYNVRIENVIINTSGAAFAIAGMLALSNIKCQIWQTTGAAPAISAAGLIDTRWDVQIDGASRAITPLVRLIAAGASAINHNYFTGRSTHSSSYVFHLEDATGNSYASNNRIYDFNFEIPNSGAIRILSGMGNIIDNVGVYDLTAPATTLVSIGKSASSTLRSYNNSITTYYRLGGSVADGSYDICLEADNALATALVHCGATAGFAVDWGTNNSTCVNSEVGSVGSESVSGVTAFGLKHVVKIKANHDAPSVVGAGSSIFDPSLHKVLTSDGTNWRDGDGNIV